VSEVTRLQAGQLRIIVQLLARQREFALLYSAHTSSGAHAVSYLVDTVGTYLGVSQLWYKADHRSPFNVWVNSV
jgi:hypothetical protein